MKRRVAISAGFGLAILSLAAGAQAQSWSDPSRLSVGLGVGTNGGVVEGAYRISPQFVLRGQGAFVDFNYGFHSNDAKYSGQFRFNTGGAYLDWHPAASAWLISGGVVTGERRVDVSAKPNANGTITIHGVAFPTTEVGSVEGRIDYGSASPFAGVGWDDTYTTNRRWGVRALVGVVFGDHPPSTQLHAVGPFANDPVVAADVAAEQVSLRHDAGDASYYPIAQIGVTYRF
jgi:hypothetical protein